jgi:hypothetical protein
VSLCISLKVRSQPCWIRTPRGTSRIRVEACIVKHARMHLQMHAWHAQVQAHTCAHACMHARSPAQTHYNAHMHTRTHACTHARSHVRTHACMHARARVPHTYTHTHTHTHTHTQTNISSLTLKCKPPGLPQHNACSSCTATPNDVCLTLNPVPHLHHSEYGGLQHWLPAAFQQAQGKAPASPAALYSAASVDDAAPVAPNDEALGRMMSDYDF